MARNSGHFDIRHINAKNIQKGELSNEEWAALGGAAVALLLVLVAAVLGIRMMRRE